MFVVSIYINNLHRVHVSDKHTFSVNIEIYVVITWLYILYDFRKTVKKETKFCKAAMIFPPYYYIKRKS